MPQSNRKIASPRLYTIPELIELRRQMLRYARSLPRGPGRNDRRQIASSLRSLFRNKAWLDAHTVEGSRQASIDKLRRDATEAALIRDVATGETKREMFGRLHEHLNRLADEVEQATNFSR
jgi:hypothetical protein